MFWDMISSYWRFAVAGLCFQGRVQEESLPDDTA